MSTAALKKVIKKLEVEVGEMAPAWVVTFGDLMSLLLCFFVLLLSFSETDKATYKDVAGSLAKAFGVQRVEKVFGRPKGMVMIARDFDQKAIETKDKNSDGQKLHDSIVSAVRIEEKFKDMIEVNIGKKDVVIRLMGESTFDSGSAEIRAQMIPALEKIGETTKKAEGEVIIAGHTDNIPISMRSRFRSNLDLSMVRAASVAQFLIHISKVKPSRIVTMGFGEFRPIESNETLEGRQRNRRVEVILNKKGLIE